MRMGRSKAWMDYHGLSQVEWLCKIMQPYCSKVMVSINQLPADAPSLQYLADDILYAGHGPISGVLTAFSYQPTSLLVTGCDYPLFDATMIEELLSGRNPAYEAVCFTDENHRIMPMPAIYEIKALKKLKAFFLKGNDSLYALLQQLQVRKIGTQNLHKLKSADTPEDFKQIKQLLQSHKLL